jgi:ABC-type transport system involved in multi-copper enzyme maturation permease subunit
MGGFVPALRSDLFLLRRSRAARAVLLVSMLAGFGRVALGKFQETSRQLRAFAGSEGIAPRLENNAYGPFSDGICAALTAGALLLVAIAAAGLSAERQLGVLRPLLTRSASRSGLVLARFASLNLLGAVLLGAVICSSWAGAAFFYDFGPVVEDGFEIFSAAEVRSEIAVGLAAAALPLVAAVSFGLLVSLAAPSAAAAATIALISTIAFDLFKGFLGGAARYVYASFLPALLDRSYLKEVSVMARGFSDRGFSEAETWLNFVVPLPTAALFVGLALAIGQRRKM